MMETPGRRSSRLKGGSMPAWKELLNDKTKTPRGSRQKKEDFEEEKGNSRVTQNGTPRPKSHSPKHKSPKPKTPTKTPEKRGGTPSKKREEEEEETLSSNVLPHDDDDESGSGSDSDAPEAVSLSVGKKVAAEQRQHEIEMKKSFVEEKKSRARKIFRSDNVRERKSEKVGHLSEKDLDEIDFIALEEPKTEPLSRKRKRIEAKPKAVRKVFGDIEVRTINEPTKLAISPKTTAFLERHFARVDRSDSFSTQSGKKQPASSFSTRPQKKRK